MHHIQQAHRMHDSFTIYHELKDLLLRFDLYTPPCCFGHKATQIKSKCTRSKERNARNEKERKAGNERSIIVDVKSVFPASSHPTSHPLTKTVMLMLHNPAGEALEGPTYHTVREMKLLYLWMFLLRISEQGPSTRSKRGLSSFTHLRGPRATTVAALGRFNNKAISPGWRRWRTENNSVVVTVLTN